MMNKTGRQAQLSGIGFALLATLIWSGNFIVAKGVTREIPPIALSFFRWLIASLIMLPIASRHLRREWPLIKRSWHFLFWIALAGISLFNTFVYIGAHYTSAINLALIGTTSSPIMSVFFARLFLKERVGWLRLAGMVLCICGVLYLLCGGNWEQLLSLHFSKGDLWVLLAAFCFAVYNTMVKKKPAGISSTNFLFTIFCLGTLLILPAFVIEATSNLPIAWNFRLVFAVLYLGLGASVICFLIWNAAIHKLGAGRTALFGNLIPVFSSIEAVILLHEQVSHAHLVSFILVGIGLLIANLRK